MTKLYKIKPLEFKRIRKDDYKCETPLGEYFITKTPSCIEWCIENINHTSFGDVETFTEAELICQKHWQELMEQCLEEVSDE